MATDSSDWLVAGVGKLVGSQIFTRVATFILNQTVTRALSVEAYGASPDQSSIASAIVLSILCVPLGAVITTVTCAAFLRQPASHIPGFTSSIHLQGFAAMLELCSEPMYIVAQMRAELGLRVKIEALALVCKIICELAVIWLHFCTEAVSLSIAQITYAAVILLGYAFHFSPEVGQQIPFLQQKAKAALQESTLHSAWTYCRLCTLACKQELKFCCNFTGQAFEKLLLAEGSKIAMTRVQDAYDQGVYGIVANLGSLVVRILFQPVEEAAFMAFSQPLPPEASPSQRTSVLFMLVRIAAILGLCAIAFGPSNSFLLLHLLYGSKYSSTEAPTALALYSPYILLLAVNGILESFVHAVASGSELWQGHVALFATTALQMSITLELVSSYGTPGMILADSTGMLLRIGYCVYFIQRHLTKTTAMKRAHGEVYGSTKGSGKMPKEEMLKQALPSAGTFGVLALAGLLSCISCALFLGRGLMDTLITAVQWSFWKCVALHITLEFLIVMGALAVISRTERSLWVGLISLKRKQA